VDEFDIWDGRVGVVGDLLLELLDGLDGGEVDVEGEGLLFGGSLEVEFDHLKKY